MPHSVSMTDLKLVVTLALWGGTFTAGRLVVQDMGPLAAAFSRFLGSPTIHGRHSFIADKILWDYHFHDILSWTQDERRTPDFSNFHRVNPWNSDQP